MDSTESIPYPSVVNGVVSLKQRNLNGTTTKEQTIASQLQRLYADEAVLKIWKTATEHLAREHPLENFPETVPQSGPDAGNYLYREAEFWTCGFFPGSVYCLLERSVRFPGYFLRGPGGDHNASVTKLRQSLRNSLLAVSRAWAEPLHQMAHRTDTHDIGFIVEPALRRDYELTGNMQSRQSLLTAAQSLASRYCQTARAIRSWDKFVNNKHHYADKASGFLVIIDSLCNLDLLYYAGHHFDAPELIDIATIHAHTLRHTHLRDVSEDRLSAAASSSPLFKYKMYSTCHVADLSPETGKIRRRLTAQGYADDSTWSRGQAWAILGYAQTYVWTKDSVFLQTACGLARYFIYCMETGPTCLDHPRQNSNGHDVTSGASTTTGRYVPLWDFDAPVDENDPLRDSSAGVIAANGMLVLHAALTAADDMEAAQSFFHYAVRIVQDTLDLCWAPGHVKLSPGQGGQPMAEWDTTTTSAPPFDAILTRATANFNANWTDKYYNHGLVYGDYYLLEFGNRLLQMGFC